VGGAAAGAAGARGTLTWREKGREIYRVRRTRQRDMAQRRVAALFQRAALPPSKWPRPQKPTGYADSSADCMYALRSAGRAVVTPVADPSPTRDEDWCFPDDEDGVARAVAAGAEVLVCNTVLHGAHAVARLGGGGVRLVGQHWERHLTLDDKWRMRDRIRRLSASLVPRAALQWRSAADLAAWSEAEAYTLQEERRVYSASADADLPAMIGSEHWPVVIKPRFGRGSEGVRICRDGAEAAAHAQALYENAERYGPALIVEEYLDGEEATASVVPRALARALGLDTAALESARPDGCVALPVVRRVGHDDGLMPYNGAVPVTRNSAAVAPDQEDDAFRQLARACAALGDAMQITAPIRVDARRRADAPNFLLFDVNMKPNATGPGRPGRDDQASLLLLAVQEALRRARGGASVPLADAFRDLLLAQVDTAWLP
jgi:D-alanine-D-alanine ligase